MNERAWIFRFNLRVGRSFTEQWRCEAPPFEIELPMRGGGKLVFERDDLATRNLPGYMEYRELIGERQARFEFRR